MARWMFPHLTVVSHFRTFFLVSFFLFSFFSFFSFLLIYPRDSLLRRRDRALRRPCPPMPGRPTLPSTATNAACVRRYQAATILLDVTAVARICCCQAATILRGTPRRPTLRGTPRCPPTPIKSQKTVKCSERRLFSTETLPNLPPSSTLIREGSEALPGTLPEGRLISEASSSTWPPP